MTSAQNVQNFPDNMIRAANPGDVDRWAEHMIESVVDSVETYAREKPLPFAAWVFGIGFVIGWKLKPW
jgi:hypothetical protein